MGIFYTQSQVSRWAQWKGLAKGENAKRFLDLHANLLNSQEQESNDDRGWNASYPARVVEREGHEGQPDDQKPTRVPGIHTQNLRCPTKCITPSTPLPS